jgi:hypothetical protein
MPYGPSTSPLEPSRGLAQSRTPSHGAAGRAPIARPTPGTPRTTVRAPASGMPGAARLGLGPATQALRTALVLPENLPFPAWLKIGEELHAVADSSAWWAGDWLIYGGAAFPDRYRQAIERTALDYQTLRNYAWVARKFESARRRHDVSFQHHQEVAALAPAEQDQWLEQAAEHGWSKAELRRRLRAGNTADTASRAMPTTRLHLAVDGDRWVMWQRAADCEGGDVAVWLSRLADRAARSEAL